MPLSQTPPVDKTVNKTVNNDNNTNLEEQTGHNIPKELLEAELGKTSPTVTETLTIPSVKAEKLPDDHTQPLLPPVITSPVKVIEPSKTPSSAERLSKAPPAPISAVKEETGRNLDEEDLFLQENNSGNNFEYKSENLNLNSYNEIGSLTAENVLTKNYDTYYAQLESKVVEVKEWLQDLLSEQNRTEEIAEARRNRGQKYNEMKALIDQLLVRHFSQEAVVRTEDAGILSSMVINEILGLGPIEPLWQDPRITEIMVNGPYKIRVEINGKLVTAEGVRFRNQEHLLETAQQILAPLGKTLDIAHPYEDGRLADGSRINATHPAIGPAGPYLTIRRFPETVFSLHKLVEMGSLTEGMAEEIGNLVYHACSVLVSGGTGSGKDLTLTTQIPTASGGMSTMGELKVGDTVLDENGQATKVVGYHPQPLNSCYELTFSDGTKIVAGKDHNWFTSTRSTRRAADRKENEPKIHDTVRKSFATELEVAKLWQMYSQREELVSPSQIFKELPRFRNVTYNTAKTLTVVDKNKTHNFYDSKQLLSAVIENATTIQNDQRHKSTLESVVTTKEIFDTLRTSQGHTNHAVRMIFQPVPYSEKKLLVSPYTFGAWLGDGFSNQGTICGIYDEIFNNILAESYEDVSTIYSFRKNNIPLRKTTYENLTKQLCQLGVLKKSTVQGETKFVPDDYLYSSVEQRRALIAGLLDTNGTVSKSTGAVSFTNSNKRIVDGFRQVVHSLGYQSTLCSKVPSYSYKGKKETGKVSYTVSFFSKDDVFRISRKNVIHCKLREIKSQGHRMKLRYIVDCQPVESVPTACITVDSPNSLYLVTNAFIVTHNTSMLNALSGCIPNNEHIITIEDNLELRLHPDRDVVAMEARRSHQGERGSVTIRDLVKNSLRQRPDRIIVGEVRDGAAYDMLQAMNTGHEGSMTTVHANDAYGAIDRLVNLISEIGELSSNQALSLISNGIDVIVSIARYEDGSRRVESVSEVPSRVSSDNGVSVLEPHTIWEFVQTGEDENGMIFGEYQKVGEFSEAFKKKHRLDNKRKLTIEELYELSEQEAKK